MYICIVSTIAFLVIVYYSARYVIVRRLKNSVRFRISMFLSIFGPETIEYIYGRRRHTLCRTFDIIHRWKTIWDALPLKVTKEYMESYSKMFSKEPTLDIIFDHLIDTQDLGDALIVCACMYDYEKRIPGKAYIMCSAYASNDFHIDLTKYPMNVANDIRAIFDIVSNNYDGMLSDNMINVIRDYISDNGMYCLHEYASGPDDEEEQEAPTGTILSDWPKTHDVYQNYLDVLDKNAIKDGDAISYNQVYKVHFSRVEKMYAQEVSSSGVIPSKLIHNLVDKGFLSSAHAIICEFAETGFMSKEGREHDPECMLDNPAFVYDLYKILVNSLDLSIYYDKLVDRIVMINEAWRSHHKQPLFSDEQIAALHDRQTALHLEYDNKQTNR